jgi:predicted dehydrogenase/threonine dehydrogenase-like Zn-dependent dehydrogenase
MKQIIQSYRDGRIELSEVPFPACPKSMVLVRNTHSVVSIGTERSMIELGRKSLVGKAKSRPDLVKRFMEKARNEGLMKTFNSAMRRLNDAMPLGYTSAGEVIEAGADISDFSPGDVVSCIGGGFACHAEYITVPENLCAKLPQGVESEAAAFGMLGIIAMHAIRCAELTPGERVAVVGLGLLGLILVQILQSYGYPVVATDLDESKRKLCQKLGIQHCPPPGEEFVETCDRLSGRMGMDAVILGVATRSNQPIHDAVRIARFRGRIVLMGVADVHPHRNDLWEKEVSLIVSKAGGPGIGDVNYEMKGIDYPPGYVRWTEKRNLEEFLRLLSEKKVQIDPLITHRQPFENALELYEDLLSNKDGSAIGVVLQYTETEHQNRTLTLRSPAANRHLEGNVRLGLIGGGLFAKTTMLPALGKLNDVSLHTICTSRGLTANHIGKNHNFAICTTDVAAVMENKDIDAVIILTRHKDHARMVKQALKANKHTFVEKPLCVTHNELNEIMSLYSSLLTSNPSPILTVGYNRRFSKLANELRGFFKDRVHPLVVQYRVNAGFIPADHWIHAPENGNGRIIGEACHMVDFLMFLTKSIPVRVSAERAGGTQADYLPNDNVVINIRFQDGSVANIAYTADGDRALSRERIEVYCDGKTAVLDDFRALEMYSRGKKRQIKLRNQDLGYREEMQHFVDVVKGRCEAGLTVENIFYSTRTVLCVHDALEKGTVVTVRL